MAAEPFSDNRNHHIAANAPHENVDPEELLKFDAVARKWWDRNGPLKALHDINPLRLGYIDNRVPLSGKRVVDAGCGGGLLSEGMAAKGAQVTGIDMGRIMLVAAAAHMKKSGLDIDYRQESAESFARSHPESFDVVTCMELLEHVPDPASVVRSCRMLAAPGGHIFFATLNRNPKSWLFAILAAEQILGFVPKGTHEYSKFIKPAELKGWAEASGLLFRDLTGMHYNPFTRRYSLGGNHHVNYMMHFIR